MVGEESDWAAIELPPFCFVVAVADEFGNEIEVDDSCSFSVFTSFSANVARWSRNVKNQEEIRMKIVLQKDTNYAHEMQNV